MLEKNTPIGEQPTTGALLTVGDILALRQSDAKDIAIAFRCLAHGIVLSDPASGDPAFLAEEIENARPRQLVLAVETALESGNQSSEKPPEGSLPQKLAAIRGGDLTGASMSNLAAYRPAYKLSKIGETFRTRLEIALNVAKGAIADHAKRKAITK